MKRIMSSKLLVLLLFLIPLWGCEDEMDKHFERPKWLKGSAYSVLQERGNFTQFLQAADKAGYSDMLTGKVLCTVFAPNDEQFLAYLNKLGYGSVEAADAETLKIIVGYHIMQYSFKKSDLLNFQISGSDSEGPAGQYYKQKTFAKKSVHQVTDPITGRSLPVYRKEMFLPAFSTELFATKKCADYRYNYNYFFPNSEWYGDDDKVYVANAGILEYAIPADNGYVYIIDRAIEPLNTIYEVLESHPNEYAYFKKMYDRFADIQFSSQYTDKYAEPGDSLYVYYHHSTLPKIAAEWTYNKEASQNDYAHMGPLTGTSFTAIVPDDDAMKNYFGEDGFFSKYGDVDEIPHMVLNYFLRNHVFSNKITLPEDFKNGIFSEFGDKFDVDPDADVNYKEMCENGTFYGVKKIIEPAPFRTVTGPLFQRPDFSIFAYMMDKASEIVQLINMDNDYTLFIPKNSVFEELGYELDMGNENVYGDETLKKPGIDDMVSVSVAEMQSLVATHIIPQKIELSDIANGRRFFEAKQLYVYAMSEDGYLVTQGNANSRVKITADLGEWENGKAYEVENVLAPVVYSVYNQLQREDRFREFFQLMKKSGVADSVNYNIPSIAGENSMIFALTNDAVKAGIQNGSIPTQKEELAAFLQYYLVAVEANGITGYILPGLNGSKVCDTKEEAGVVDNKLTYKKINIEQIAGNDKQLQLSNESGTETTKTTTDFPVFATGGIIYNIESIIKAE